MKKGLIILTAAFTTTILFACKNGSPTTDISKVTNVKVQGIPYAVNNEVYKIGVLVEGEGKYSTEVTWSVNDKNAHIVDGYFVYYTDGLSKAAEVEVTATSVQDSTKKGSANITVLPAQELNQEGFLILATKGDEARKEKAKTYYDIKATPSEDDYVYNTKTLKYVSVTSARYIFSDALDFVEVKFEDGKRTSVIPKAAQLKVAFDNQFKDYVDFFQYEEESKVLYGYSVYKPAVTVTENDLFIYCVFYQGLPIYETHYENGINYSYLNLTPVEE